MDPFQTAETQKQTIAELQSRIRAEERGPKFIATSCISMGCDDLDTLLPHRGIRPGSLVEWLGNDDTGGAGTVSLIAGRHVCSGGRSLVLIDTRHNLFPPALSLLGFDLSRLVLIRPASERDALWACEEALRCAAVGLVWANIERLGSTSFRRLQLAAEESQGVGFLVRSVHALHRPSWAEVRLRVDPCPSRGASPCFRVEVAASHGSPLHSTADILIDNVQGTIHGSRHSANSLSVVPRMDAPTAPRRSAGA